VRRSPSHPVGSEQKGRTRVLSISQIYVTIPRSGLRTEWIRHVLSWFDFMSGIYKSPSHPVGSELGEIRSREFERISFVSIPHSGLGTTLEELRSIEIR